MRIWKLVAAFVIVGLLASLAFWQVDVTPLDSHQGAVAYTVPVLSSSIVAFSSGSSLVTDTVPAIGTATATIDVTTHPYTAPVPVKKPLWRALVGGAQFLPFDPNDPGTVVDDPVDGTTCTQVGEDRVTMVDVITVAKLQILEPGGTTTEYTSPQARYQATDTRQQVSCSDGTSRVTHRLESGPVSYEVGAYYFTKGHGDYQFSLEIHLVNSDGTTTSLGAKTIDVSVAPAA